MPTPKVKAGESQQDYVSRCMVALDQEHPNDEQRSAICYNTYRDTKAIKETAGMLERVSKAVKGFIGK